MIFKILLHASISLLVCRRLKSRFILDRVMEDLIHFPDTLEKMLFPVHHRRRYRHRRPRRHLADDTGSTVSVDILESHVSYVFFLDVPGFSKSEIQLTLEDDEILVVRTNGKRKRENASEEECKHLLLERNAPLTFTKKFRLPKDSDSSAISARCEDGLLKVSVGKKAPPAKSKSVEVSVG